MNEKISFLRRIPFFANLDNKKITTIANIMVKKEFAKYVSIISEEEIGKTMYILLDGKISCRKKGVFVRNLLPGDYFGELSVFFDIKRSTTITPIDQTAICYEIAKENLLDVLGDSYKHDILYSIFLFSFLKTEKIKNYFLESQYKLLYNCFKIKTYKDFEVVYQKDNIESLKKICIVLAGCLASKEDDEILLAKRGDLFGEKIIEDDNVDNDIISNPDCLCLEANWDDILKSIQHSDKIDLYLFERVNSMKKIKLFAHLSDFKLIELSNKMVSEKFLSKEIIIKKGVTGDKFYIISSGYVKIFNNNIFIRELEKNSSFGEISLLKNDITTATVQAGIDGCECFSLEKKVFKQIIDSNMIKYLKRVISLQGDGIMLNDLYFIKPLGNGKFGTVSLVHNKKNLYAIKAIPKSSIIQKIKLITYFLNEKRVMSQIDHPFVVKLVKTLNSKDYIFYLLEYIDGSSFKTYLEKRILTPYKVKYEVQFYGTIMLNVISYLNKKNIVYRDFKPENMMLDKNGYLKIVDFGTAKEIKEFTHTVIGTPYYFAPEILLGKGYSFPVDYWSIGVCLYEIYYGKYPFGNGCQDVMDIYKEILQNNVIYNKSSANHSFNSFIMLLLVKNPTYRCCEIDELSKHSFMSDFSWDDLCEFKLKPPFIPEQSGNIENTILSHNGSYINYIAKNGLNVSVDNDNTILKEINSKWVEEF